MKPTQRFGRSQEALLGGQKESGGISGEPGGVGRARRGQEVLLENKEGSRVLGGVGRAGKVWDSHPEGWERSGGPPAGPGGVGRHSRRVGRGREAHSNGRGGWKPSQKGREETEVHHRGWEWL